MSDWWSANQPPAGREILGVHVGDAAPTSPQPAAPSAPTSGFTATPFDGSLSTQQAQDLANQYLAAAGQSPDTNGVWGQYWQQWGSNDPDYFRTRLLNGIQTNGGNMSAFGAPSTAKGGWGPGTVGYTEPNTGALGNLGTFVTAGSAGGGTPALPGLSPAYAFDAAQGLAGLQKSAAANGTLLTGGTLKAIQQYGQGLASNEFQNDFNRQYSLANLGLNATTAAGNYGSGYAANAGNTLGQIGNAQSAGSVAQGNIWGGTVGQLGSVATDLFQQWKNKNQSNGSSGGAYQGSAPYTSYFGSPYGQGPLPG